MKVELLDSMGSDLSVVNAARVSFDKTSEYIYKTPWSDTELQPKDIDDWGRLEPCGYKQELSRADQKLIQYLATHGHWSPFAHAFASFRIKAPLFVARQLGKHQVGLAWNEVSRRYVDDTPEFYDPPEWRLRATNVKQGSSSDPYKNSMGTNTPYITKHGRSFSAKSLMIRCVELYESMIAEGICPEQARMVLPQSMMTTWIWSGSLMAFRRVCSLRMDPHTQAETREVAYAISDHMEQMFPHSWAALAA